MSLEQWDAAEKAIAGSSALGLLVILGMKAISFFRAEKAGQSGSEAIASQFEALNKTIKAMSSEMEVIRAEFHRVDRKVHIQQRTITRFEMALRHLASLVSHNGIDIPESLQDEIDALLKVDEPSGRRATDKPPAAE